MHRPLSRLLPLLALVLLVAGCGGGGDGGIDREELTLLAEYDVEQGGGSVGVFSAVELTFASGALIGPADEQLFDGFIHESGAAPVEAEAHAENDPDFALLASLLTNGTPDELWFVDAFVGDSGSGAYGVSEADIVASVQGPGVQDLAGFEVVLITYEVTEVVVASPGRDVNNDGNWTDASYKATLRIWGREQS